jgi:hypothetical protein
MCSHDIDIYIDIFLANIIDCVFDSKKEIRDNAHKALIKYLAATKNIDKIWKQYYAQGLTNSNLSIRARSIRGMQNILEYDPTVLSNSKNTAFIEFRRCLES